MIKRKTSDHVVDWAIIIFLVALMIVTLYPFVYSFLASFSDSNALMKHTGLLLSFKGFSIEAYTKVFTNKMIGIGYTNTLMYVAVGTSVNLILTSFGAYVLSRKSFSSRHIIMFFISFTMFFGGGMIPTFLVVKGVGLYDNFWAMILPNAVNTWNLIIMRNGMSEIPESMEESARIDGANDFQILFKIMIPLSQAVMAVMILFYAVGHWNTWFNAMLYLRSRSRFPLQLVLREILISNSVSSMTSGLPADTSAPIGESIKYATMMVATIPVLLIYPLLQKYFVKGVMVGAIKG